MNAGIAHGRRKETAFALAVALGVGFATISVAARDETAHAPAALMQSSQPTRTLLPDGRTLIVGPRGAALSDSTEASVKSTAARTAHALAAPDFVKRAQHTATVLPDGRALLWGGLDANGRVETEGAWFDPARESFAPAGDVELLPRAGHAATLLTDGRLLVTGGWNPSFQALAEAELWDYRTNHSELLKGELVPPRMGHSASLLTDGRVLILGGYDEAGRRYADAALYDPDRVAFLNVDGAAGLALANADSDAPTVAASIPKPELLDFPPDGLIALRFATAMDVRSLNVETVTLIGREGAIASTVVGAGNGRLLFVRPATDLYPGSRYTLFVDGAKSTAGAALPFTAIGFSTATLSPDAVPPGAAAQAPDETSRPEPIAPLGTDADTQPIPDSSKAMSGAYAQAGELLLGTGTGAPQVRPGCAASAPSNDFCRDTGSGTDGFWLPGRNNEDGYWRINGSHPAPPDEHLLEGKNIVAGATLLYGQVFRIDDRPVSGVEVSIGNVVARTDAQGVFVLTNVPSGRQTLVVDGTTASADNVEYGDFVVGVDIKAGARNPMPYSMYLPRIHPQDKVTIPSPNPQDIVITHPEMPGLEIHIPAGTVLKDRKGHAITDLAIVPMPVDRAPFPSPVNFPIYFMFQPGGAVIQGLTPEAAQGVRIVYPNMTHEQPGQTADFAVYDPADGWTWYGNGHVTADGRQITPDAGVGLHMAMGASYGIPTGSPPPEPAPPPCPDDCSCGLGSGPGGGPGGGLGGGGGSGPSPVCGDPVDLSTGLFLHRVTDLRIADVLPIDIVRTYRTGDSAKHAFGVGMSYNYGLRFYNPSSSAGAGYTTFYLVLPDGSKIQFQLASGTIGQDGATWLPAGPAGLFQGTKIVYRINYEPGIQAVFVLERRDGLNYLFDGHFSVNNVPLAIQDRFGNRISFSNNSGLISRIRSPSGRTIDITYGTQNRITQIRDNTGRTVSYTYTSSTASGLLDTVTYDHDSTSEHYTYYSDGRMHTVVDRRTNTKVTNEYYADGRVKKQTLADNAEYGITYTLDGTGAVTLAQVVDPRAHVREVSFNTAGYMTADKRAVGTPIQQLTTYERDPTTQFVTAVVDALNRRTEYNYDIAGNRLYAKYLAGTTNQVTYTYTYTPDYNQIHTVTDPLNHTTTYDYTNGCLTRITDALGHHIDIVCNSAGQPTRVTDALLHATQYGYLGYDPRTETDALNRTTTYTTDELGRLVATQDPLGNLGRVEYDSNDRVARTFDPSGNVAEFGYDGNGNLTSIQDPNNGLTQFGYDARNRKTSRTDALTHPESWAWDGMGNLLTHTDRKGQLTQYAQVVPYDALDRLQRVDYADGSNVTLTWDAGNRLTVIADTVSGTITRVYDGLNRLTSEQTPQGTAGYSYDAASRRTTMTPASQAPVVYDFDIANRLNQITQGTEIVTIQYDNADRRTSLTLPNGQLLLYVQDAADQLTKITYTDVYGYVLGALTYEYDDAGRRVGQSGFQQNGALSVPTTADGQFNVNNEQTAFNGTSLSYDLNGNLTSDGTYTYQWDARDRLVTIKQGTTTKASFQYDAFGRRVAKTIDGGTMTNFLYDGWNAVQEVQGSAVRPILTGLGIDERYARTEAAGRRYFLTDALGSTLALTDGTRAIKALYSYGPYGEVTATGTSDNPYQYTGRENDGTGFYYYRARYYSPTLKRFVSEDPIGLNGGLNEYAYVGASPTNWVDFDGLEPKKYEPPSNPNKRKGADDRQPGGDRERNIGHPKGEEHSRRPKGGFKFPKMRGFIILECMAVPVDILIGILTPSELACPPLECPDDDYGSPPGRHGASGSW